MKDIWFSDSRDIVKWGVLKLLADGCGPNCLVVQLAFYRGTATAAHTLCELPGDGCDQKSHPFPQTVLNVFRRGIIDIKQKNMGLNIEVFTAEFAQTVNDGRGYRSQYITGFIKWLKETRKERVVLLVDPDTGLDRGNGKPASAYIRVGELAELYSALNKDDWLVLYQHAPRTEDWIEDDRRRISEAIKVDWRKMTVFLADEIASDVAFFAVQKREDQAE